MCKNEDPPEIGEENEVRKVKFDNNSNENRCVKLVKCCARKVPKLKKDKKLLKKECSKKSYQDGIELFTARNIPECTVRVPKTEQVGDQLIAENYVIKKSDLKLEKGNPREPEAPAEQPPTEEGKLQIF